VGIDTAVLDFFQERVGEGALTGLMKAASFLAEGGWFWIALSVVLLIFPATRKAGLASAVGLLLSLLLTNLLLKNLIARPRPYDDFPDIVLYVNRLASFSFPSGHTSSSFASAGAVFWFHKKWGSAALALAAVIAFSRVYLSMHYLTDVLAGLLAGALYAAAGICAALLIYKRFGRVKA
jgi:undecaprenyl-diphosphatase